MLTGVGTELVTAFVGAGGQRGTVVDVAQPLTRDDTTSGGRPRHEPDTQSRSSNPAHGVHPQRMEDLVLAQAPLVDDASLDHAEQRRSSRAQETRFGTDPVGFKLGSDERSTAATCR